MSEKDKFTVAGLPRILPETAFPAFNVIPLSERTPILPEETKVLILDKIKGEPKFQETLKACTEEWVFILADDTSWSLFVGDYSFRFETTVSAGETEVLNLERVDNLVQRIDNFIKFKQQFGSGLDPNKPMTKERAREYSQYHSSLMDLIRTLALKFKPHEVTDFQSRLLLPEGLKETDWREVVLTVDANRSATWRKDLKDAILKIRKAGFDVSRLRDITKPDIKRLWARAIDNVDAFQRVASQKISRVELLQALSIDPTVQEFVNHGFYDDPERKSEVLATLLNWQEAFDLVPMAEPFNGMTESAETPLVETAEAETADKVERVVSIEEGEIARNTWQPRIELLLADFMRRGLNKSQIHVRECAVSKDRTAIEQYNPYYVISTPFATILVRNLYGWGTYVMAGSRFVPAEAFKTTRMDLRHNFGAVQRKFSADSEGPITWVKRVTKDFPENDEDLKEASHTVDRAKDLQYLYQRFPTPGSLLKLSAIVDEPPFQDHAGMSFTELLIRFDEDLNAYESLAPLEKLMRLRLNLFAEKTNVTACLDWSVDDWKEYWTNEQKFPTKASILEALPEQIKANVPGDSEYQHEINWVARRMGFTGDSVTKADLMGLIYEDMSEAL